MGVTDKNVEQYKREWGYWLGGAIISAAIYVFVSLRSGNWEAYWPVVPLGIGLGIWALVLIVAPLFGSGSRKP